MLPSAVLDHGPCALMSSVSLGLESLVQLSSDLGLKKEHEEYVKELKKAHKSNEIKEQVTSF